jgi:hypothetical protein
MMRLPATVGSPRGVTVEGASPALLAELLKEFEVELRNQGIEIDRLLRPGATRQSVIDEFRASELDAPDEAIVLFGWHNGRFEVPGAFSALPVFAAWSLEYLAAARDRSADEPRGFGEWEWNPNWIRIMGDQYGIAMCCADRPENAPLIRFVSDDLVDGTQDWQTERQVVSLCTPVTWWIESLRRGWYRWIPATQEWKRDVDDQPIIRSIYGLT